jgi:hypothetical protein
MLLVITACFNEYAAEEKVNIQSRDGRVFSVSKAIFSDYSKTLKDMFEEIEEDIATPIPLPNINSDTLDIIIRCVEHPDYAKGILLSLNPQKLIDITTAISYLDMPKLFAQLPYVKWITQKAIMKKLIRPVYPMGAISNDGRFIVTGSGDTAKIWNTQTGECVHTLQGHKGIIYSIAISHDDTFIVTGSGDTTAKIWNIQTGECVRTLQGHTAPVNSVAISHDGRFIVTDQGIKQQKYGILKPENVHIPCKDIQHLLTR